MPITPRLIPGQAQYALPQLVRYGRVLQTQISRYLQELDEEMRAIVGRVTYLPSIASSTPTPRRRASGLVGRCGGARASF